MTQRELQKLQVLSCALEGQLPLKRAAAMLGVSYRHVLRLKATLVAQGPPGLVHGNVGRAPANRIDDVTRARILDLSEKRYSAFNDVHLAEMLADKDGIHISRETLRRILRAAGRPPKRVRRPKRHHRQRERSPSKGMMLLWDGSQHRWLGPDAPACTLMAAIDDADNEVPFAFFCPEETSAAYLELLQGIIRSRGVPFSIYMDRHSALKRNDHHWSLEEQLAGRRNPTQVGMVLRDLGITPIFALSAQAKGRVERLFDTLQDRLTAELELASIHSIDEANRFLKRNYLAKFNKRFAHKPATGKTVYRSARGLDLKRILSFRYSATVSNDNTVRIGGKTIQIHRDKTGRGFAKSHVDVRQHLDGSWTVYYQDSSIARARSTPLTEPLRYLRKTSKRKMKGAAPEVFLYSPHASPPQCDIFAGQLG